MDIIKIIAQELDIPEAQVASAVTLIDEGNTVPFIARYRKEVTGGLDDAVLRNLNTRLESLRALEQRRGDVRRLIEELELMTDDISKALDNAKTVTEIDDIYRPFRPKRRTRATIATERGLAPLADLIFAQARDIDPLLEAEKYLNPENGVESPQDALAGASDIIAEKISDNAAYRKWIRDYVMDKGMLSSSAKTEADSVYRLYYDYLEPLRKMVSHRILAINRGEKEGILSVKIEADENWICNFLQSRVCLKNGSKATALVADAVTDAYKRLIAPSVQNEVRSELTENAQAQAVSVFGENLNHLLLQPPVRGKVVLGFDPAYRTGCKIAVVSDLGALLDTTVVYPTQPQNRTEEAKRVLTALIQKHKVDLISIGNGTASKESEIFIAELIKTLPRPVAYVMTSEAGASVYSASELGSEEFPELDVSLRSAISIARRLQDPLAELTKIEPRAIGVGQYQHDMNPKVLDESLSGVVESCVSSVGADLNTASWTLLSHIAGLNSKTAKNIYQYRLENTRFSKRAELKKVKGLGPKAFTQCAGFLRVPESCEVLDNTAVHPESYAAARKLLELLGYTESDVAARRLSQLDSKIDALGWDATADKCGVGAPTLRDIANELQKPGRDMRDSLPQPILRTDVMDIGSLKPGMELVGTVRNVADFGAFVDIGVHQDGLVHISRLSDHFIKRALDAVSIGDIITVRVLEVDPAKKRISLERVFEKKHIS